MKVFQTLAPPQQRNLAALFLSGLMFWSSLTMLLPTLPPYIRDASGSDYLVGWVMGSFAIGLLLFRSILGRAADRHSRKAVVLLGTAIVGTAPLCYALVHSVALLALFRAFHGISIAAFTTGYSTLVVDISPPEKKGELIGYMSLVVPIGMALGPAVGGLLQVQAGYTTLFLVSAAAGFWGFFSAALVHEPRSRARQDAVAQIGSDDKQFWQLLLGDRLRTPATVMLLMGLVFGTLASYLPLYVRDLSVPLNPGWFYTTSALASFTVRVYVGRASDRYGRGLFISCSLVAYITAMFILATAQSPQQILGAAVLQGAGAGTLIPMAIALMADRSRAHERGKIYSLCLFGYDFGIALGGPLLGSLSLAVGYRGLFFLAAGLAALALAVFLTRSSKDLVHSLRFATGQDSDPYAVRVPEAVT
ncbi:MFS transporter [Rubidibacter lacunae]|uniref:MFS transporter n=1 Tax=Rubidibacter lacunae TaxID=582514 RepID=UPI000417E11E|nr:MFS transporter [Rubidibacter lacunae]